GAEPITRVHLSKPHNVHYLPFPALQLVRPGRPMPDKASWEVGAGGRVKILKVFRIDARRLGDEAKLDALLTGAVRSKDVTQFENMTTLTGTVSAAAGGVPQH